MLWMYDPISCSKRSTTDGAIGAPPLYTFVSDDRSRPGHDGSFISAMNTVIAPTVNVGRYCSIRSSTVRGSKRYPSTIGIGTSTATAKWAMSPVMWNRGATPSTESAGVRLIHCRYTSALNTTLRCVFIAPFGGPVVPDVYVRNATPDADSAGAGADA